MSTWFYKLPRGVCSFASRSARCVVRQLYRVIAAICIRGWLLSISTSPAALRRVHRSHGPRCSLVAAFSRFTPLTPCFPSSYPAAPTDPKSEDRQCSLVPCPTCAAAAAALLNPVHAPRGRICVSVSCSGSRALCRCRPCVSMCSAALVLPATHVPSFRAALFERVRSAPMSRYTSCSVGCVT